MKKIALILAIMLFASCALVSCSEKVDKNDPNASIKDLWDVPYQYDLSEYIDISEDDYIGIPYTARNSEVTDEDIQAEISALLEKHATTAEVERAAEKGDRVVIDFQGFLDGVAFEGGTAEDVELELGVGGYIPGFEEGIVGHKKGETFTVDATFPEDYGEEGLNGKTAQFEITLNKVAEVTYPTLNDEFVQEHTDYSTVMDYYASIQKKLEERSASSAKVLQKNEAFEVIVQNCEILEYPEKEYDQHYQQYVAQYVAMAQSYGQDFETFLKETAQSTMEEFVAYAKDYAKSTVQTELVFFAIAEKEGVLDVLTKAHYDDYLENIAAEYLTTPEKFLEMYGEDSIWRSLVWDTVMDFILENVIAVSTRKESEAE